jgi:hypothetical protein
MLLLLASSLAAEPDAADTYARERLFRSPYAISNDVVTLTETWDPKYAPTAWAVFDGAGRMLTADQFADDVGDVGMQSRLQKEDDKTKPGLVVATVAAIAAMSAGSSLSASGMPDPRADLAPPDPRASLWQSIKHDRPVSRYYSADLTDELIVAHNAGLRRALGLNAEEVAAIEAGGLAH